MVDKKSERIVCTNLSNGKRHDYRLFKESGVRIAINTKALADTGYLGLQKTHTNTYMPKKKSKKSTVTVEDKLKNHELSSQRVLIEHVIGKIKRFKILSDKYRNRRKRFALRFNLISGIYNDELQT